jgi:hypothetical protein
VFKVPLEEVTPQMRTRAKAVNFGIVYGIGEFSLAKDIKVSVKEARNYIESYFETYRKIKEYIDKTIKFAKYVQYFLCFIVVVEILISFIFFDIFAKYGNLGVCQYQPTFLGIIDYFRDELECITLLVLVVCCSLKNKFYKTKLILAILVAFLLFISHFILAVYNLWGYITFRFLFNQLTSLFPSIIVSIIGLAPVKQEKVGDDAHIIPQE